MPLFPGRRRSIEHVQQTESTIQETEIIETENAENDGQHDEEKGDVQVKSKVCPYCGYRGRGLNFHVAKCQHTKKSKIA